MWIGTYSYIQRHTDVEKKASAVYVEVRTPFFKKIHGVLHWFDEH